MKGRWNIIWIALWFALVFGLAEGTLLLIRFRLSPAGPALGTNGVNERILWIAPALDAVLFLLVAAALWCVLLVTRRWPPEALALATFSFLSILGLAILPMALHRWASLALVIGVTFAVMRWCAPRHEAAVRFLRRSLPVALAAVLALAVGQNLLEQAREDRAVRGLPAVAGAPPNVLLVVMDTMRGDRLAAPLRAQAAPHLSRMAGDGVLFANATTASSWSLPAHVSLLTGLAPSAHGAWTTILEERHVTLAETLARHGYVPAAFVANNWFAHGATGLRQGFVKYRDFFGTLDESATRTVFGLRIVTRLAPRLRACCVLGRLRAADINRMFLGWLDAREELTERPFFVFLNYSDAHERRVPEKEYVQRFSAAPEEVIRRPDFYPDAYHPGTLQQRALQHEIAAYDAAIAYMDEQLRALLEELARRGKLANTLIVVTSDHGESLAEHGLFGHGSSLYREQIHVPLFIRLPGGRLGGTQVDSPVSLTDVAATVLQAAGLPAEMPGRSLLRATSGGENAAEDFFAVSELNANPWAPRHWQNRNGPVRSILTAKWHLIAREDGRTELFDWRQDPAETNDLAQTAEGRSVVAELLLRLEKSERGYAAGTTPASALPDRPGTN
jgi:arylsulfatase A-like enzyme